jgi:hypothetical protein
MPMINSSVESVLARIICRHAEQNAWRWLQEKKLALKAPLNQNELAIVFSAIPSKTGKAAVSSSDEERKEISNALPDFSIESWSLDKLCRVWILMQIDASEKDRYTTTIESLFQNAEMNELVALYSALPVLAYPEGWRSRCSEGIRTNIGDVLAAIVHDNPYPANYLDEAAWNQMVLKAFFTEKDIRRIVGLDHRSNLRLALTLADYASERASAGRPVNPELWPLVEKYSLNRPQ